MSFHKGILEKKWKIQRSLLIDSVCNNTYRIVYYYFPLNPSRNRFDFYGTRPNAGAIFPVRLFSATTLDEILDFIQKTYPKMSTADWTTLNELWNRYNYAEERYSKFGTEKSKAKTYKTAKELGDFQIEHGLLNFEDVENQKEGVF